MSVLAMMPLSACGMGKIAECNKLIQVANAQQEVIKNATTKLGSSDDPADIENLATTMEKAGKDIAAVDLKDQKLKGMQKDYQTMLDGAAKNCRELVTAVKAKNIAGITKAKTALGNVGTEESKVVGQINAYCQGG
jgi:hypothetical protein